jgi:hypothetical protein
MWDEKARALKGTTRLFLGFLISLMTISLINYSKLLFASFFLKDIKLILVNTILEKFLELFPDNIILTFCSVG